MTGFLCGVGAGIALTGLGAVILRLDGTDEAFEHLAVLWLWWILWPAYVIHTARWWWRHRHQDNLTTASGPGAAIVRRLTGTPKKSWQEDDDDDV
jgi:hypothetical protein